jgi:hypothetical protein
MSGDDDNVIDISIRIFSFRFTYVPVEDQTWPLYKWLEVWDRVFRTDVFRRKLTCGFCSGPALTSDHIKFHQGNSKDSPETCVSKIGVIWSMVLINVSVALVLIE